MKNFRALTLILASAFSCIMAQTPLQVGWSTGYYTSWAQAGGNANYTIGGKPYTPDQIPWKAYTHMVHFSVTPNSDGSINLGGMGLNASMINAFVTAAHNHNVKAIICIGGGGTGGQYASAAANATVRAKFIQSVISFMKQYGYDGADIDWEDNIQTANYLALFQELRAAFNKLTPVPLITEAVASYFADQAAQSYPYVDQMNNMSYWTKLSGMDGVMDAYNSRGVPKTKQGVGIGLDYQESGNPEVDCDPTSAKNKALYAINKGYGGIMIWEIEMDARRYNGQTPIHDTLSHYMPTVGATGTPYFVRSAPNGVYLSVRNVQGTSEIRYGIPSAAYMDLGLFDASGNRVRSLLSGPQEKGLRTLVVAAGPQPGTEGAALAPGAYIVKLTTAGGVAAGTIIAK